MQIGWNWREFDIESRVWDAGLAASQHCRGCDADKGATQVLYWMELEVERER